MVGGMLMIKWLVARPRMFEAVVFVEIKEEQNGKLEEVDIYT